jgi:8-oxo-dGTP diphosphatase
MTEFSMNTKKFIYVSAAFMPVNRKLMVVRRPEGKKNPLKWELPGGKVHENESFENSLIREIKEELDLTINVIKEIGSAEIELENEILIFEFILVSGEIKDIILNEHVEMKLVTLEELEKLDLSDADINFISNYKKEIKEYID